MAAMPPTSTKRVSVVARLRRAASWGAANLGSFRDSIPVLVRSRQSTDASAGVTAPPVTLPAVAASSRSDRTAAWQAGTWQAVTWQAVTWQAGALQGGAPARVGETW